MTYLPNRVHVGPHQWASHPATDFWLIPGHADLINASGATNLAGLNSYGWTTTALAVIEGSGDSLWGGTATRLSFADANDALVSPTIFGSAAHRAQAASILRYTPTKLNLEIVAQFLTVTANENTTFMGFAGAAVTDITAAGGAAGITSGGTGSTFFLESDNASDAGADVDTSIHTWRIEVGSSTTEWFIDNVSQGTITTESAAWPAAVKIIVGTTNRLRVMLIHVWYD